MGKVHALFADAPAPVDLILDLETRLAAALDAEARCRREHGASCLAREQGDSTADTDATASRLRDAVTHRQNIEAAIEAATLGATATEAFAGGAAERIAWNREDRLIERRAHAVRKMQQAAEAIAVEPSNVRALTAELWNATPRQPTYTGPNWSGVAPAVAVHLYAITGGLFAAPGVIDSSFVMAQSSDLCAVAEGDHANIWSERCE
jgi:hypothetical protein